ncbi:MAG: V-type ATPase subunit [Candidatus Omnitrophica bacterium]|nr:V-type ATPase subunit [Candidatus Omnitrophota bacterium]MCM8832548.1 V-type ATPase subunit [Candidatus Omnitrophota bacterium]
MLDIYFLSGRINSLEKKFIDFEKIKKIVECRTFEEFVNILEGSFFKMPTHISNPDEIFNFFENERYKLIEEIRGLGDEIIVKFFLIKYDFFNLTILIENKQEFSYYGTIEFYILKDAFEKNDLSKIPDFLHDAFSIFKSKFTLEEKTLLLKNNYYKKLYEISLNLSDFCKNYVKIEIDFANIKNYLNKKINEKKISINDFIENGNIKREFFLDENLLLEKLKLKYKKIEIPLNEENIENQRYKVLIDYLRIGRIKTYGIDKIISFYLAREIEIENIQRIAIAKFYKMNENFIKKALIPPYQYKEG